MARVTLEGIAAARAAVLRSSGVFDDERLATDNAAASRRYDGVPGQMALWDCVADEASYAAWLEAVEASQEQAEREVWDG